MVQWLGFGTFTPEGTVSIPDWGTKNLLAAHRDPKKKKKIQSRAHNDSFEGPFSDCF